MSSSPLAPLVHQDDKVHRRKIAEAANNALRGRLSCTGSITLNASATTTTLTDSRIGLNTFISLMPMTSDAQAAVLAGYYWTSVGNGSAVLNHTSSAAVDQTFTYVILG